MGSVVRPLENNLKSTILLKVYPQLEAIQDSWQEWTPKSDCAILRECGRTTLVCKDVSEQAAKLQEHCLLERQNQS